MNHIGNDSRSSAQFDGPRAARTVIRRKWTAIPLVPNGKRPKLPEWQQNEDGWAREFGEESMWRPDEKWAGCNVGVATEPSGLVVLDVDVKQVDGAAKLAALLAELGLDPERELDTFTVRTPSGGLHYYFEAPPGLALRGRDLCEGVNTRARGGQVVAAGSHTADGVYRVKRDAPVRILPAPLAERLADGTPPDGRERRFTEVEAERYMEREGLEPLRQAGNGERNNRLNNAGVVLGHFVPEFVEQDEALARLLEAAQDCGLVADKGEDAARATARSGLAKGMGDWKAERRRDDESDSRGSWGLVDLAPVLAGDVEVPSPTVLARSDGEHLLYPGSIHWVFGEPESGKSWVALAACVEQIRARRHVLYLDYENGAVELVARLTQFGLGPDEVGRYFHMLEPETRLGQSEAEQYAAHLQALRPAVVVLDAFTEVADMEGLSPNDAEAVSRVVRLYLKPAERAGAAVVVIDHVVKDTDRRGLWPSGSQHKKSAVSGAAYLVRMRDQFAPGRCGRAELVVAKDRRGKVRAISSDKQAGTFILNSDSDGCAWQIVPGAPRAVSSDARAPDGKAGEIVRHLDRLNAAEDVGRDRAITLVRQSVPGFAASKEDYSRAVKFRKDLMRQATSCVGS